jgi:hypothetical protein
MPKKMRSKNARKAPKQRSQKKDSRVGRMRNGTRGDLQLSISNTSTNRNYAGAQTYIKMSKDNLRSLQLLAGRLDKADLNELGVSASQQPGLKKHFVILCKSGTICFSKNNLNEFPELKGNTVVKGSGSNPKGQSDFCELLEKVVKALYKGEKSFARDRLLKTLKALRKNFASMGSNKSAKSVKSAKSAKSAVKKSTAKNSVKKSSSARSRLSSANFSVPTLEENSHDYHLGLTADCNYDDILNELQTILDTCSDEQTRIDLVNELEV